MKATNGTMNRWDRSEYLRVVAAHYADGHLVVRFADGDEGRVDVALMTRVEQRRPRWREVRAGDYEVTVPTEEGDFDISAFGIRALTDAEFDAHLKVKEAESARWVGRRVRELRGGRGLTIDALAERARVAPSLVESIEQGTHDGDLGELERVVGAMDHDMRELIRPQAAEREAAVGARSA